ncbi:MAG: CRISPR-associated protein Csn2-St [Enterococcus sp.]
MSNLSIEYEEGRYIDVQIEDYLLFLSAQSDWKRKIIRSFRRFADKKTLSSLEQNLFGETLEILEDGKLLKSKERQIYFLSDNRSIYEQLSMTKGNLMYEEISSLADDLSINEQLEKLNDELLRLEVLMNKKNNLYVDQVSAKINPLNFEQVIKNFLDLQYIDHERELPLELMNSGELLDEFIALLERSIKRKEQQTWVVIETPASFLTAQEMRYLFEELKRIARETKQLKFFIFAIDSLDLPYTVEDIPKTILFYESYQQLPDFLTFRESIARHYPDSLKISDEDLVQRFYQVSQFFGIRTRMEVPISPKSMVLLKVLKILLEDHSPIETSIEELSSLEKAFLM